VFLFQGISVIPTTVVGDVVAGGPAAQAGIVPGDTILSVAGTPVADW
jgi:regulator of sigma E protease